MLTVRAMETTGEAALDLYIDVIPMKPRIGLSVHRLSIATP